MYDEREDTIQGSGAMTFLCGLFAGMAIGAGIGLLFAPKPGAELRGRIANSASAAGKRMSDTIDAVADAGRDAYHQARDVAATASGEISRMAGDVSRSAEQSAAAIRSAASRTRRETITPA